MGRQSRKKSDHIWQSTASKYSRFLVIPLVVLVLVLVIIGVDKVGNKKPDAGTSAPNSFAAGDSTGASCVDYTDDGTVESLDLSGYHLVQDEVEELTALVQAYCQAKTDIDPEAVARIFGRTDRSEEELESMRSEMELVAQTVEGYENVSCYAVEGLKPDTYVIYPYYEIQYREAEAVVPYLTWSYARRDDTGQFYMTQDVSDGESAYIAEVSRMEDVKNLAAQVAAQAEEAKNGDAVLRRIYQPEQAEASESTDAGSVAETTAQ